MATQWDTTSNFVYALLHKPAVGGDANRGKAR